MPYPVKITLLGIATVIVAVLVWAGLSLAVGADYTNGAFYYGTELTANVVTIGALALAVVGLIAGLVRVTIAHERAL